MTSLFWRVNTPHLYHTFRQVTSHSARRDSPAPVFSPAARGQERKRQGSQRAGPAAGPPTRPEEAGFPGAPPAPWAGPAGPSGMCKARGADPPASTLPRARRDPCLADLLAALTVPTGDRWRWAQSRGCPAGRRVQGAEKPELGAALGSRCTENRGAQLAKGPAVVLASAPPGLTADLHVGFLFGFCCSRVAARLRVRGSGCRATAGAPARQ